MLFFGFVVFWPCHAACDNLRFLTSNRTWALAVEAQSYNHWTAREFLTFMLFYIFFFLLNNITLIIPLCVCVLCVHIVKEFRGCSNMYA